MSETAVISDSARVQPSAKWFATGARDSWFGRSSSWPGGRGGGGVSQATSLSWPEWVLRGLWPTMEDIPQLMDSEEALSFPAESDHV